MKCYFHGGNAMLDPNEIKKAVLIHEKSYQLLLWMQEGIKKGFISFESAKQYTRFSDRTYDWLQLHYIDLPKNCRPEKSDLRLLANYFSSYLNSSFELVESPGRRKRSHDNCFCQVCHYWEDMPHLKTKKLTVKDKNKAYKLMQYTLDLYALENEVELTAEKKESITVEFREWLALCTYAQELLKRVEGRESSAASLALWRSFAWNQEGSPKHSFELTSDLIMTAEKVIVSAIIN
jgi:hypothetical protein